MKRGKCQKDKVSLLPKKDKRGVKERRSLSYIIIPLPLIKGKGIKGIGLPNKNLKGVRLVNTLSRMSKNDTYYECL